MNIGEEYIYRPIDYVTKTENVNHIHYGKKVTVIDFDVLGRIWIAINDFPQCNQREYHNRFLAEIYELYSL